MTVEEKTRKVFDLEERTFLYAKAVRTFLSSLKSSESHLEDKKQLIRSSGSVAANYLEANEALSRRDFSVRIKISKKEAKESYLWLRLVKVETEEAEMERKRLIQETIELGKIFGAILQKMERRMEN
jgi:four helix bundle protein